ncbi:MAG: class I SAM-dependent methyltransferase [Solirubrobacteraceae bacterium]
MSPEALTSPDDPRLDGWYHTIELAPGVVTRGVYDHRSVLDRYSFPEDLTGQRVLDVGPANGYFSFELERRGADVVAMDLPGDEAADWVPTVPRRHGLTRHRPLFELAHATLGSAVEYRRGSIYELDVARHGVFDLVFCGSLLLHLMHPMQALLALRSVTRGMLILETAIDPSLADARPGEPVVRFGARGVEEANGEPIGSRRTYWWFTPAALAEMLAHAGFRDVEIREPFALPPTGLPVAVAHARP